VGRGFKSRRPDFEARQAATLSGFDRFRRSLRDLSVPGRPQRLAELHRQAAAPAQDRPVQGLEILRVEPLPDVPRESAERAPVHALDHVAPACDHDQRRR